MIASRHFSTRIHHVNRPNAAYNELGGTRTFIESLPFHEMNPRNDLVETGMAFCLAKLGDAYALCLPNGGHVSVRLATDANYEFGWWNPRNDKEGRFPLPAALEQRVTAQVVR